MTGFAREEGGFGLGELGEVEEEGKGKGTVGRKRESFKVGWGGEGGALYAFGERDGRAQDGDGVRGVVLWGGAIKGEGDGEIGNIDRGFLLGEPLGKVDSGGLGHFLRRFPSAGFSVLCHLEGFDLLWGVNREEGRNGDVPFGSGREGGEKGRENLGGTRPEVFGGSGLTEVDGKEVLGDSLTEGEDARAVGKTGPSGGDGSLLARIWNEVAGKGHAKEVIKGEAGAGDLSIEPTKVGSEGAVGGYWAGPGEEEEAGLEILVEGFLAQHAVDEVATRRLVLVVIVDFGGGGVPAKESSREKGEFIRVNGGVGRK